MKQSTLKVVIHLCLLKLVDAFNITVLESPRLTHWGEWGEWEYCSQGHFVVGFQLKVEAWQHHMDNTALNGIALLCCDGRTITSKIGPWGSWTLVKGCGDHSFMNGFQMRQEPWQTSKDDTAANNMRVFCAGRDGFLEGAGESHGYWTQAQKCSNGTVVCGLRTQIEGYVGEADDTSLNSVDFACCNQ